MNNQLYSGTGNPESSAQKSSAKIDKVVYLLSQASKRNDTFLHSYSTKQRLLHKKNSAKYSL